MDQRRLFLTIAVSLAILLGFQWLIAPHLPHPAAPPPPAKVAEATPTAGSPGSAEPGATARGPDPEESR